MKEYIKCRAISEGYAKEINFLNGPIVVCNLEKDCEYRMKLHLDTDPHNICMVDGKLVKESFIKKNFFEKRNELELNLI